MDVKYCFSDGDGKETVMKYLVEQIDLACLMKMMNNRLESVERSVELLLRPYTVSALPTPLKKVFLVEYTRYSPTVYRAHSIFRF